MDREVTLMEMLEAREVRAGRQRELLERYARPVVSFTLNIAGPVKNGPVIRRAFREGLLRLEDALAARGLRPLHQEEVDRPTGCEALWAVDGPARTVKELCAGIEDRDPLGRLFDLDVLDPEGGKWDREALGLPPRPCLVCGKAGKGCASRRLHPEEEIQEKTQTILRDFFAEKDRKFLAAQGARALLYEVCTTPKPGLVDRHNNGSHKDMDVFTFLDSTAALLPYLERAAAIGQETARRMPEETFERLREAGLGAERTMLRATGGVNTHKGAIFSLGILSAAAGYCFQKRGRFLPEEILSAAGKMVREAMERDFSAMDLSAPSTHGERLYARYGCRGIRGEAADGFPSIRDVALPVMRDGLQNHREINRVRLQVLLSLMAAVEDTNILIRSDMETLEWARRQAADFLREGGAYRADGPDRLAAMNRAFVEKNISPGGCADLLAGTIFLTLLEQAVPSGERADPTGRHETGSPLSPSVDL